MIFGILIYVLDNILDYVIVVVLASSVRVFSILYLRRCSSHYFILRENIKTFYTGRVTFRTSIIIEHNIS